MNEFIYAALGTLAVLWIWFWFLTRPHFDDRHVVVDVETTGTDPNIHEILEIAILNMRGDVLYHTKISPQHIETAEPKALEINSYDPKLWEGAPRWQVVEEVIRNILHNKQLVGHNVNFDKAFILGMYRRYGLEEPDISYQVIDSATLIFEHLLPIWRRRRIGLSTVMRVFWPDLKCHSAKDDAEATRRLVLRLVHSRLYHKLWWRVLWFLRG